MTIPPSQKRTKMESVEAEKTIDEDLYSRQIGALGMDTMVRLINLNILIIGQDGTGVDAAKNIILAGPASVTLIDDTIVSTMDLAANCMIQESSAQQCKKRSEFACQNLKVLNDYVKVSSQCEDKLADDDFIQEFDVVLVCNYLPLHKRISLTDRIRKFNRHRTRAIPVIFGDAMGLLASVFCDFGAEWEVRDSEDTNLRTYVVTGIFADGEETQVYLSEDTVLANEANTVKFEGLLGNDKLTELNGKTFSIVPKTKYSFVMKANCSDVVYEGGGTVTEVRVPVFHKFKPFSEAMTSPIGIGEYNLMVADMADNMIIRPPKLHKIYISLLKFWTENGRMAAVRDYDDIESVTNIMKGIEWGDDLKDVEVEPKMIQAVTQCASCVISPMASIVGGIAAQEVLKTTGKFTPLKQFLHMDFYPFFPETLNLSLKELNHAIDRYTPIRNIFGESLLDKIRNCKLFLVGAGALGCEYLKNLSLTGFCTGPDGKLTVTDMDMIENSNLNRQFLFRKHHINSYKSDVASVAAVSLNREFRVASTQTKVDPESEDFFDDRFWNSIHAVINALDNVESRMYVDSRCIWYEKPLLESGTLGVKCNSQAIVPHITETYSDSVDPPEKSIPLCTLKNFPYKIDHCIQWARDAFEGLFTNVVMDLMKAAGDQTQFEAELGNSGSAYMQVEQLESMIDVAEASRKGSFTGAVELAHKLFYDKHNFKIQQLQHNFPETAVNKETGIPFWSGTKRFPQAVRFDPEDELIRGFYYCATCLYCAVIGIPANQLTVEQVIEVAKSLPEPQFQPRNVYIKVDDDDDTPEGGCDDSTTLEMAINRLRNLLASMNVGRMKPIKFEKDDDTNGHIDFIHAMGNLRARNYRITGCERYESKAIAGKIVPALATSTALITGVIVIELIKMMTYKNRPLEEFRSSYISLAEPTFVFIEPLPPKQTHSVDFDPLMGGKVIARPEGFSTWQKAIVEGNHSTTLKEFITKIESTYNVTVYSVGHTVKLIYMLLQKAHAERLNEPLIDLIGRIMKKDYHHVENLGLEVTATDVATNDDVSLPVIKFVIK